MKHCFLLYFFSSVIFPLIDSAQLGVGWGGVGGMITFGPCGSFHGSVGMSTDPGPVES